MFSLLIHAIQQQEKHILLLFFLLFRKKINFNMKNKNDLFFWGVHVHNEFPEMYFMSELKQ